MTSSSHSSDEGFLESLGIYLEEVNVTADADTHASVTGIYAQSVLSGLLRHFDMGRSSHKELLGALAERWWDTTNTFHFSWGELTMTPADFSVISGIPFGIRPIELYDDWRTEISPDRMVIYARYRRGELTATQVARFTLLLLFASTFWSNRKEKFNPSILRSLENLAHLEEYDWAGAFLSRMYDDMCDLSRGHWLVPSAWRWYRSNLHTVRRKKSLRDLIAFFDTCTLEQVEVGAMNARLQSWIQADLDFQQSDALSRRRVVLSHPVLRRYYLGERVDTQIRGCRFVPYSPPEDMQAGKQMTLTAAHTEGKKNMNPFFNHSMHSWTRSLSKVEKINLGRPLPNPASVQTSPEYRTWFIAVVWPIERPRRTALLSALEGEVGESLAARDDSEDVTPRRRLDT
ncbi:hypothetical protein JCGZ_15428 [Jatropha curcas]|uniref:Aminotransferase-like plant mobile domain-containing protein n=1 Tax=Jatropha curcas TaxID=180498 RepID=A0A067K5S4_JATCU|nr:hypothetical protein JCGZ_15428 [Jatropha curcas]